MGDMILCQYAYAQVDVYSWRGAPHFIFFLLPLFLSFSTPIVFFIINFFLPSPKGTSAHNTKNQTIRQANGRSLPPICPLVFCPPSFLFVVGYLTLVPLLLQTENKVYRKGRLDSEDAF